MSDIKKRVNRVCLRFSWGFLGKVLGHANIQHADLYSPAWRDVHGEIYDLYSVVREHDFFENEEAIVL